MFKRLCAHYEAVAVVCLLILITSISADLSKFYNDEGDIYEDYDYYEDDNITNYSEASDDQDKYGASQEKPPKKLNLADKVESGKLGTRHAESLNPSVPKIWILRIFYKLMWPATEWSAIILKKIQEIKLV